MITASDNVLRNQLIGAQTRATNTNAFAQVGNQVAQGAASLGNYFAQQQPGAQQMRENALAQSNAQARVAKVQGLQAEAQIVAPLLAQVEQSQDPAAAYAEAVRVAEAAGVDIAPEFETYNPDNMPLLKSIYTMPAPEMTEFEGLLQGLTPEQRVQAVLTKLDLIPGANARLRGQTGDKAPSGYRFDNAGNLSFIPGGPADPANKNPGLSITTADGTVITQGGVPTTSEERFKARERELGKQDAARAEAGRKARNSMASLERRDSLLLGKIDEAVSQVQESFTNTGLIGQLSRGVGGTPAFNLQKTVDTIKANLGFNELNAMREASPTGGALGNVTEREIEFLQAVQGSLDTAQNEEQLLQNLQEIRQNIEANANDRRSAFDRDFGEQQGAPEDNKAPSIDLNSFDDDVLMKVLGQ